MKKFIPRSVVYAIYNQIVTRARLTLFYQDYKVADTFDGRFELISLHMIMFLYRLKGIPSSSPFFATARDLGQKLYDLMFGEFDVAFREMGIGDLGVGKRVKEMVKAFHGRLQSYDRNFKAVEELAACFERNIYRKAETPSYEAAQLASYASETLKEMLKQEEHSLLEENFSWPFLPSALSPSKEALN